MNPQRRHSNMPLTALCITLAKVLASRMVYEGTDIPLYTTKSNSLIKSINISLPIFGPQNEGTECDKDQKDQLTKKREKSRV